MDINAQIIGKRELARNLIGLGRTMSRPGPKQPLEESALAGGRIIAERASELAPRSIGGPTHGDVHAADTILPRIVSSRRNRAEAAIGPDRDHFYLMFHEIGTSKLPARPHLQPAVIEKGLEAAAEMRRVWRSEIDAYAARVQRQGISA